MFCIWCIGSILDKTIASTFQSLWVPCVKPWIPWFKCRDKVLSLPAVLVSYRNLPSKLKIDLLWALLLSLRFKGLHSQYRFFLYKFYLTSVCNFKYSQLLMALESMLSYFLNKLSHVHLVFGHTSKSVVKQRRTETIGSIGNPLVVRK